MLTEHKREKIMKAMVDMQELEQKIDAASVLTAKPLLKNYIAKNRIILALICSSLIQQKEATE